MPDVIIRRTWEIDGTRTAVTSAKLSNSAGTFGVKRNDTDAVVVADDTLMTTISDGVYEYTFTGIAGVSYTAFVEIVYDGQTYHIEHDIPTVEDTSSITAWTSQTEMAKRYGQRAIEEWTDHDDSGAVDGANLNWHIEWASNELAMILGQRFNLTSAGNHSMVRNWATIIASFRAATERGNPAPEELATEYERLMEYLKRVESGDIQEIVDYNGNYVDKLFTTPGPTVTNRTIDRSYRQKTVRVDRHTGSRITSTSLPRNYYYPFRYEQ